MDLLRFLFFSPVMKMELKACGEAGSRLFWGIVVCGMKLYIYVDNTIASYSTKYVIL